MLGETAKALVALQLWRDVFGGGTWGKSPLRLDDSRNALVLKDANCPPKALLPTNAGAYQT